MIPSLRDLLQQLERLHAMTCAGLEEKRAGGETSSSEMGVWINLRNQLGKLNSELRKDIP